MSSILVRFPDGTKEFRYHEVMLEAGAVVWHEGGSYRVVSVEDGEQAIAVVESASPSVEAHVLAAVTTGTPMVMSEQLESTESVDDEERDADEEDRAPQPGSTPGPDEPAREEGAITSYDRENDDE